MKLFDKWRARAAGLASNLGREVADSAHSAVYLRQLLRGNRATREHVPMREAEREPASPARTKSNGKPNTHATETDAAPTGRPVLLIHGYLATRGSLHLLERHLTQRGHVVMSYKLGPINLGDIRDSAGLIARKVESIVAQTGVTQVDIVGHSMGGLVGLYYLKRLGGRHRVRRLVLLGTPARGTWSALLGLVTAPLGLASLQLLPGSPFLRELAEMPLPERAEVISIGAERDWLAPLGTTVLKDVRHISVATGHSGLLVEEEVADVIDGVLRE
jgi:triacylglycerol lipase